MAITAATAGILSGAVSAGSGLLSGGLSAVYAKNQQKRAMEYNTQMYEKQRADEIAMWRMNNEFNAPSAQVQRLLSAGINPASQFGEGSLVGNSSTAPSNPSAQPYPMQSPAFIGDAFRSTAEGVLRSMLVKSQIEKNEADAQQGLSQAERTRALLNKELEHMDAETANIISSTHLNEEKKLELAENVKLARATFDANIEVVNAKLRQIIADTSLSDAQREKAISDTINSNILTSQNVAESNARIKQLASHSAFLDANAQAQLFYNTQIAPLEKTLKEADARIADLKDTNSGQYFNVIDKVTQTNVLRYQKEVLKYTAEHCSEKTAMELFNLILKSYEGDKFGFRTYSKYQVESELRSMLKQ